MASWEKTQTSHITLYKKNRFLEIIETLVHNFYQNLGAGKNKSQFDWGRVFTRIWSKWNLHVPDWGSWFAPITDLLENLCVENIMMSNEQTKRVEMVGSWTNSKTNILNSNMVEVIYSLLTISAAILYLVTTRSSAMVGRSPPPTSLSPTMALLKKEERLHKNHPQI